MLGARLGAITRLEGPRECTRKGDRANPLVVFRVLHPHRLEVGVARVQHGGAIIVILVDGRGGLEPRALVNVNRDAAVIVTCPRDDLDAALGSAGGRRRAR